MISYQLLIRETRLLPKTMYKGVSFYMWHCWYFPFDGSKCCRGDEGLLTAHIRNENNAMETFLVGHAEHRPEEEWFEAPHGSTHYFYGLSLGVKSRKQSNCNALSNFRVCRKGWMTSLLGSQSTLLVFYRLSDGIERVEGRSATPRMILGNDRPGVHPWWNDDSGQQLYGQTIISVFQLAILLGKWGRGRSFCSVITDEHWGGILQFQGWKLPTRFSDKSIKTTIATLHPTALTANLLENSPHLMHALTYSHFHHLASAPGRNLTLHSLRESTSSP